MIKGLLVSIMLTFPFVYVNGQSLTAVGVDGLVPFVRGELLWLDKDNDNRLELLTTGLGEVAPTGQFFNNVGLNEHILDVSLMIDPLIEGAADTGDFNGDGFVDFVLTGLNSADAFLTQLYLNDTEGGFTAVTLDIAGTTNGKIRLEDFNNDTRLDLFITGADFIGDFVAALYLQNEAGELVLTADDFPGIVFGDVTYFDANDNGIKDVLLTGLNEAGDPISSLYLNDGSGTFTLWEETGIDAAYHSATDVADYDSDGDLDLVVIGKDTADNVQTRLYEFDDGIFEINDDNEWVALAEGNVQFVDIDGNDREDLFITGEDDAGFIYVLTYLQSSSGDFILNDGISNAIVEVSGGAAKWADYDNDGDFDLAISGQNFDGMFFSNVYKNDLYEPGYANLNDSGETKVQLFPNPSSGTFSVVFDQMETRFIIVKDVSGKTVQKIQSNNLKEVITMNAQKGIYFLQIQSSSQIETYPLVLK